jgi:hypothetical protein
VVAFALVVLPRVAAGGTVSPTPEGVTSVDPAQSEDGNYTVMWTVQPDIYRSASLGESINGGAWQHTPIAAGEYSRTFTGRPPGTYRYRTERSNPYYWGVSNEATVLVPSFNVGLIPGNAACANGAPPIEIQMDDEDSLSDRFPLNPRSYASGWTGAIYVDGNRNTHFRFCEVDGKQFKPLTIVPNQAQEYAVIKLGDECPRDSVEFGRYFDNEDGHRTWYGDWVPNANWYSGDISPNWQNGYGTMLRFCLFRYGSDTLLVGDGYTEEIGWPDVGFSYGVFAASGFAAAASGFIHVDDEDDDTQSYFDIPWLLDASSVYRIVEGYPHWGGNTDLYTSLVRYQ